MRFLDLFSGIGGFRLGLEKAGHECIGHVEIDKYARKSYEAMHNTEGEWTRNDITEVSDEEWQELRGTVNLIAGGTPCQSFSIAGKRLGFEDTRGTLFFYYANAIKHIEPEYFMFENVKGLISHDKGNTIKTILKTFDEIGYAVDFDIFNSKYYGVPQNRERIFIVGKRKTIAHTYPQRDVTKGTKAIDKMRLWAKENIELISILPSNTELEVTCRLRDVLETEVDEKFYLSKEQTDRLVFNMGEREKSEDEIKILAHRKNYRRNTQVFDKDGLTETLDTGQGGGRGHYTMEDVRTHSYNRKDGIGKEIEVGHTLSASDYRGLNRNQNQNAVVEVAIGASRGRNPKNPSDRTTGAPTEQRLEINQDGTSNTLTSVQKDNYVVEDYRVLRKVRNEYGKEIREQYEAGEVDERIGNMYDMLPRKDEISNTISTVQKDNYVISKPSFRIRKLTPLECFRLQGFPDELFYKAQEVNSNSQLYKQAGNSVTVNVIEAIANKL